MSVQIKVESESYAGHPKDVTIGRAKICFNHFKQVWVTPGGGMKFTRDGAEKYCSDLNNFISRAIR